MWGSKALFFTFPVIEVCNYVEYNSHPLNQAKLWWRVTELNNDNQYLTNICIISKSKVITGMSEIGWYTPPLNPQPFATLGHFYVCYHPPKWSSTSYFYPSDHIYLAVIPSTQIYIFIYVTCGCNTCTEIQIHVFFAHMQIIIPSSMQLILKNWICGV